MKRTFMSFIAFVLAILLSANCVFAQNTATLPFTDDFSSNSGWTYINADDNYYNSWDIVGGRLFVYQGFGDYTNSAYAIGDCATSYAYRNIQLGTSDSIRIQFDITVGGERSTSGTYYDYAAVLLAPMSQTYTGSTSCSNPSCINSQYVVFGPMAKLTSVHKDTTIVNPAPNGTYKIVFLWHNDGSSGDGISATINNLSITEVNAPEPLPEVNMSKYITLTVTQGDSIYIGIQASADNTPVKIKSGSWDTTLTVGYYSYTSKKYKSQSSTMTIYGNVEEFYCHNNGSKITALDVSHNTSLTHLNCVRNQLTSLDVSGLTDLSKLLCNNNQLTSLNVSGCTNLFILECGHNQLTSLNVSGLTSLWRLICYENQLTSLNANGCTNLGYLNCNTNQLTSLNVNGCTSLEILNCYVNQLTSLDVSSCTSLETLDCRLNQLNILNANGLTSLEKVNSGYNQLTSLGVSGCTNLLNLSCYNNQLTSLDVSGLTSMEYFYCGNNQLSSLNVNGCLNLKSLQCYNNQLSTQAVDNLYCQLPHRTGEYGRITVANSQTDATILATNITNATNKYWKVYWIDTTTWTQSEILTTNGTYVCGEEPIVQVDASKYIILNVNHGDSIKINVTAYENNTGIKISSGTWDKIFTIGTTAEDITFKASNSYSIVTIYGNIKEFRCVGNNESVTALDASHNTTLMRLYCNNNQITNLNVAGLTSLERLDCYNNQLTRLDISGLTNLKTLLCNNNRLTSFDVIGLANLEYLNCSDNQLTSLNIGELARLKTLYCQKNMLSTLSINKLYCQLPDRASEITEGELIVAVSSTDEIVLATNKTNATDKNWAVKYYDEEETNEVSFPQTNGAYVCTDEPSALEEVTKEQITLYPNPAKDYIVLEGVKGEKVKVFDANGRIVKQEVINERLDIRDLQSGVYYLQVNGKTTKLIKQ